MNRPPTANQQRTLLYAAGALAAGGVAWYYLWGSDAARAKRQHDGPKGHVDDNPKAQNAP